VKRCKFCGREGSRMTPVRNQWVDRIDGWKCTHPIACIRRQEQLGQWQGKRVLYRQDADDSRWTIRRTKGISGSPLYTLTCEYRQPRVTSQHPTIEAAKAHCGDVERSWEARSLREYTGGER
jgi:hypothetical protein